MQTHTGIFEKYFTVQEEKAILGAAWRERANLISRRDYWTMMVMRHSGGRVASVAALNVGDAEAAVSDKHLTFRNAKGGKTYGIFATKELCLALRALLRIRVVMGYTNDDPDAPLLMSRNHRRITTRSLQLRVEIWRNKAGIRNGTPHFFRHTMGRRLLASSTAESPHKALMFVQGALGHSHLNTTAIYAAPGREEMRRAMEAQA